MENHWLQSDNEKCFLIPGLYEALISISSQLKIVLRSPRFENYFSSSNFIYFFPYS